MICYEPIIDDRVVEIPTPSWEPDKFAHQDCFITKVESLSSDATKEKMLNFMLGFEQNNDIDYLRDKSKPGIDLPPKGIPLVKLELPVF